MTACSSNFAKIPPYLVSISRNAFIVYRYRCCSGSAKPLAELEYFNLEYHPFRLPVLQFDCCGTPANLTALIGCHSAWRQRGNPHSCLATMFSSIRAAVSVFYVKMSWNVGNSNISLPRNHCLDGNIQFWYGSYSCCVRCESLTDFSVSHVK